MEASRMPIDPARIFIIVDKFTLLKFTSALIGSENSFPRLENFGRNLPEFGFLLFAKSFISCNLDHLFCFVFVIYVMEYLKNPKY